MREPGKLENEIRSKLDEFHPGKDFEALWDQLEPTLPKKKNKRYFFLWYLSGVIVILTGYWLMTSSYQLPSIESAVESTKQQEVLSSLHAQNNSESTNQQINNVPFDSDELSTTYTTSSIISNREINQDNNNYTQKIYQDQHWDQTPKQNISTTKTQNNNLIIHQNQAKINDKTIPSQLIPQGDLSHFDQRVVKVNIDKDKRGIHLEPTPIKRPSPALFPPIQNELSTINTPFSEVSAQDKSTRIRMLNWGFLLGGNTALNSGGMDTVLNNGNIDPYLEQLEGNFKVLSGFHIGAFVNYKLSERLIAGFSLEYSQLIEKFEINTIVNRAGIVSNPEAFLFNGGYIAADQEAEITKTFDILNYNKLHRVEIKPEVSYQLSPQNGIGLRAYCSFSFWQSYNGKLVDSDFNLVKSGKILKKRHVSVISPGFSIFKDMRRSYKFPVQFYLAYQFDNLEYKERRHVLSGGIRVGISH